MMANQLPALIVVLPLVAGLLMPFLRRGYATWLLATATTWGILGLTIALLFRIYQKVETAGLSQAVISYSMGGWTIPWGIEYRVDPFNAFMLLIIALVSAVVTLYARLSVAEGIPAERTRFFYALWLLFITGLLGITVTGDAFNVYVLVEISSLAAYTLVAMGKYHNRQALPASMNYLVLGTIGGVFFLIGVGYLYSVTGTLNMADLAERIQGLHDNRTVITAVAFLLIGLGIKMALAPFHGWLPGAHAYAPSIVSAALSGVAIKVGAYVMIRFIFTIFGVEFSFEKLPTGPILLTCACIGILGGSYMAIQQATLKRVLAYSSVAQMGYITLGFALANEQGLTGSLIHVFNHALTKSGLFLAAGIVVYRIGETDFSNLQGLGRKMPWTAAALTAGGLGLIGAPLTSGFVSKWYLVTGALDRGLPTLAGVVLLGSLLAVIYVWRFVEVMYFRQPQQGDQQVEEAPWSLLFPVWILIGASLYFGIDASLSSHLANGAARALLNMG
jgi:multicomponent Na+:H+ antiporter subunit D